MKRHSVVVLSRNGTLKKDFDCVTVNGSSFYFDGAKCRWIMKISREDVLRVAELAHLELSPGEIETYRSQLDEILTYIAKLEGLDVSSVEPMAQVLFQAAGDAHPELREDTLRPCDFAPAVLAQAADAKKPFFRVPRVIER